jgi:hypothetical protein
LTRNRIFYKLQTSVSNVANPCTATELKLSFAAVAVLAAGEVLA